MNSITDPAMMPPPPPPPPSPGTTIEERQRRHRHQQHVIHHQRLNAIMDWPQLLRYGSFGGGETSSSSSIDEVDVFNTNPSFPTRTSSSTSSDDQMLYYGQIQPCCYDSSPTTTYMKRPSKKTRLLR